MQYLIKCLTFLADSASPSACLVRRSSGSCTGQNVVLTKLWSEPDAPKVVSAPSFLPDLL